MSWRIKRAQLRAQFCVESYISWMGYDSMHPVDPRKCAGWFPWSCRAYYIQQHSFLGSPQQTTTRKCTRRGLKWHCKTNKQCQQILWHCANSHRAATNCWASMPRLTSEDNEIKWNHSPTIGWQGFATSCRQVTAALSIRHHQNSIMLPIYCSSPWRTILQHWLLCSHQATNDKQ